jgi:hypothetical protein
MNRILAVDFFIIWQTLPFDHNSDPTHNSIDCHMKGRELFQRIILLAINVATFLPIIFAACIVRRLQACGVC